MRRTNGTRPPFSVSWKPTEGGRRGGEKGGPEVGPFQRTISMRGLEPRSGRRPYLHASKRTRGALLTPSRTKDPWKRGTKVCQDTRSISLNSRHATSVISRGFHSLRLKQSNISYSSTYSFRGSRSTRDVRHFRWILNKRGMGEGTFLRLKSIEYLRYI